MIPCKRLKKESTFSPNQGNPSGCKIGQRSVLIENDQTAGNAMALIFNLRQIPITSF